MISDLLLAASNGSGEGGDFFNYGVHVSCFFSFVGLPTDHELVGLLSCTEKWTKRLTILLDCV